MAFDFKKEYKEFYMPKDKPAIISVPKMNYIAVRGKGDPNDENGEYKAAIGLLYGMLERLISAMTREGKFKEAIQSKIGTTVDTSDMEKEMAVLSAKLHQAEGIKTRIEQQMDSLDVNTPHY